MYERKYRYVKKLYNVKDWKQYEIFDLAVFEKVLVYHFYKRMKTIWIFLTYQHFDLEKSVANGCTHI